MKHTPLPWGLTKEDGFFSIRSSHAKENGFSSEFICSMDGYRYREDRIGERKANADFIITACNSHYDLIDSRDDLLEACEDLIGAFPDLHDGHLVVMKRAIAKAKGETHGTASN